MRKNSIEFIAIFLIQLVISLPFIAADAYAFKITDIRAARITPTTAAIEWSTDNESASTVKFGKTKILDLIEKSAAFVSNHSVTLNGLNENTNYFFSIESENKAKETAIDNNSNSLYSFKTLNKEQGDAPGRLILDVSIPRYVSRNAIDIAGTTKPMASVSLFVNNMNSPVKTLSGNEVSTGRFFFSQILLSEENTIKITAAEKSGESTEKNFEIGVDSETPIVKLDNISALSARPNISITGSVSEPLVASVFIDTDLGSSKAPEKVKGLNATKVTPNSVELKWDESTDKDFSHYVVYRSDIGAIALTKPASFNLYVDALVDTNTEYKYEVSAVNIYGEEGFRSEPLSVKTLAGGLNLGIKPQQVDIYEDFRKPLYTFNVSGNFNFVVNLGKGDGNYNVKLVFEDKAGNKVTKQAAVSLDTKKPQVRITKPSPGAFVYENLANEIEIAGKTKPNAKVYLYVNRFPFSLYDQSVEISGLPNEVQRVPSSITNLDLDINTIESRLQNLSESQLNEKCGVNGNLGSSCKGADESVMADANGNFEFKKIDLTASPGFGISVREVPVTEFRDQQLNQEAKQSSKKSTILVVAQDKLGQRGAAKQTISIGSCWSGNQSWDVIPLTQYQGPTFLSTERLAEGTETLYFYFNYSYIGRGSNARIKGISFAKACSSRETVDPRYNASCRVMTAGDAPTKLNADGTLSYSAITLGRYEEMDKFVEQDWKNFLESINDEMSFPFRLRIAYEHDVVDDTGVVQRVTEYQTTCQEVSYAVDSTIINPVRLMPDWLINDFVGFLDKSIKALTKVQEQIDRVIDYVAIGCLYSFLAHLAVKIYRNWIDLSNERFFAGLKGAFGLSFNLGNDADNQYCTELRDKMKEAGRDKLKFYSDIDLKKCFPSSYGAWQREAKMYELQRWSCDRIFGHSSPAKWTEGQADETLQRAIEQQQSCEGDESAIGQRLRAEKCRSYGTKYPELQKHGLDERCVVVRTGKDALGRNTEAIYILGGIVPGSSNVYEMRLITGSGREGAIAYAVKSGASDDYFLTSQPQTCSEICGVTKKDSQKLQRFTAIPTVTNPKTNPSQAPAKDWACITVNDCRKIAANRVAYTADGIKKDVLSVDRRGFTKDCFYDGDNDPSVVSDSAAARMECCCLNTKGAEELSFYEPTDKNRITGKPVHEAKGDAGGAATLENMKWSYRYSRIRFEAMDSDSNDNGISVNNKYNPDRYIEGRDKPACFGQNHLFSKLIGPEKVLALNPQKQATAAVQCAYLTGVNQRLQMYKNIMASMSNCLTEIRTSGRADAGVCKELFTQHVCGAIWQVIQALTNGCNPEELAGDAELQDDSITEKLKIGFKGISQGISEAQQEMSEEYGNVYLDNLFGTGQGGIARKMCLAAFGYDWDFTAKNLVDAAYTSPFATLVQPVTKSREFLTIDPVTLRPKYEYRSSWIVNPGCDLDNYKIELACVSRKEMDRYPNQINCGSVGASSIAYTGALGTSAAYNQCDCLELTGERIFPFYNQARLKQNVLYDDKDIHKVIESEHRYDHLKFTLRTDRRIKPELRQNCFPPGYEEGIFYFPIIDRSPRDILDCSVDPSSGVFACGAGSSFFSGKGTAQLLEVSINNENPEKTTQPLEFRVGDSLNVGARVTKTGKDKCIRVSIAPDPIEPKYEKIEINGISDIAPIQLTGSLSIAGTRGNFVAPPGMSINVKSQENQHIVTISAQFIDNVKDKLKAGYISGNEGKFSKDDTVRIEGYDVDMANGVANIPAGSTTKITINGNVITVEKEDAEKGRVIIEITDVIYQAENLQQAQDPTYERNGGGVITVYPPQQSTSVQQPKTVTVEIFHLKQDRDAFYGAEDCSLNDGIIKKQYRIIVSQRGADSGALNPVIQNLRVDKKTQTIGTPVVITAKITHPSLISIVEYSIEFVGKDGTKIGPRQMTKDGDNYRFDFDTVGMEPQRYTGTINAASSAGSRTSQRFEFDLIEKK